MLTVLDIGTLVLTSWLDDVKSGSWSLDEISATGIVRVSTCVSKSLTATPGSWVEKIPAIILMKET